MWPQLRIKKKGKKKAKVLWLRGWLRFINGAHRLKMWLQSNPIPSHIISLHNGLLFLGSSHLSQTVLTASSTNKKPIHIILIHKQKTDLSTSSPPPLKLTLHHTIPDSSSSTPISKPNSSLPKLPMPSSAHCLPRSQVSLYSFSILFSF